MVLKRLGVGGGDGTKIINSRPAYAPGGGHRPFADFPWTDHARLLNFMPANGQSIKRDVVWRRVGGLKPFSRPRKRYFLPGSGSVPFKVVRAVENFKFRFNVNL